MSAENPLTVDELRSIDPIPLADFIIAWGKAEIDHGDHVWRGRDVIRSDGLVKTLASVDAADVQFESDWQHTKAEAARASFEHMDGLMAQIKPYTKDLLDEPFVSALNRGHFPPEIAEKVVELLRLGVLLYGEHDR